MKFIVDPMEIAISLCDKCICDGAGTRYLPECTFCEMKCNIFMTCPIEDGCWCKGGIFKSFGV